jgi:predicted dehydrogenase
MNIGTLGTGPIVDLFLDAVSRVDGVTCTAVCSRQAETARPLADKYGVSRIHTDYAEMLQDRQVDCVYIATPNSLHFNQARQALMAGKHVIVEKPFTSTAAEAEALIELSRQTGLYLFEAITTIHFPNFLAARAQLASLGPVKLVQCNYSQYSSRYDKLLAGENPNIFNPIFSGGSLYDINIYNLHFAIGLFGLPKDVRYFPNLAENGIDTSGVAVLTYDGSVCVCTGAKDSASPSFAIVQGTRGTLRFDSSVNQCQNGEIRVGDQVTALDAQADEANRLVHELRAFSDCIRRDDRSACDGWLDHSLAVIQVAEAARKSAGIVFPADGQLIR